ncbi:hypothetical protein [Streptomyces buecherae]|uniref:hypothetical protein n=1 Tax=Streptomyces buecherae TaxID=2763006 RepID=UPI00364F52A3
MKSTPDAPSPARQRPHAGAPAAGQHTGADTELAPTVGESPGVSRAVRTPPAPVSGGPGLDRSGLQRLQRAAGNAAVSRLVAQRYAAPVKPSPAQAPGFRRVKADVGTKKQTIKQHQPATTESRSAQDAAVAPPDDKEAQGKAAQAEKMNAAKPGEFNKQAFIDAVNKAIADQAPKNLNEADKFADSGKADQVREQVDGKVTDGKKTSAKDIETTTKAAPDTSKAKTKKVTPMTADKPPGNPGAPSADDAVPDKQPPEVTDFSDGPRQNDKAMADAEVTEKQLAKGNEPQFDEALSEKKKAEDHAKKAGPQGRQAEDAELADAKAGAAAAGASAMASLTATRSEAGQKVDGGKGETKSKDEKKREEVTAKLQKVFDATKKDVESTLEGLDKKVDDQFTKGEKAAKDAFTEDHKRRMEKYKDKRYSGFRGKLRWVKDKFKGLPEEGLNIFKESRKLYVSKMQGVISSIADTIGTELGKAKARIRQGRSELKAEVDKLPEDLKKYGQEAAKDFEGKFEDLETKVNDKSDELVQTLAQKYTEALNKVDDEIKKLQDANKGLIAKAKDAIVGAIKTIMELKNLLMGILAKAASAIGKIIKDPIGFLGNLVKAVGAGLNLFTSNILDHLKKGLVAWLLGTATKEGIEIPAKFDMKGIIQLVGSMLGLTWDNLRARIVGKGVPEPAMEKVEQSVPVAGALSREGPAGAMDEIQADTGDLKTKILDDLKAYLVPTVIIAGISWIVSLLTPASAFVRAVKGIIDIVTFIVNQGAQIVEFVNAVLDAVIAIAGGGSAGVPKMVEAALAASIPLLIGFLAALVGVGGLANKVKSVLRAAGRPVKRALDKIVGLIAKKGRELWSKFKKKSAPENRKEKDDTRSRDVKREAREMLSVLTAKPLKNRESLDGVIADVHDRLRPKGLRRLYANPHKSNANRYTILAVASPSSVVGVATLSTAEKKDIIRAAMNSTGTINFLKKMADNKVVSVEVDGADYDVNMRFFENAWSDPEVQRAVSKKFRQAVDGNHEWLPAKYILDVAKRARDYTDGAKWIDVQHKLRSETQRLVFTPSQSARKTKESGKDFSVPQGHVGAVYFTGTIGRKTYTNGPMVQHGGPTGKFHKALGTAFTSSGSVNDAVQALRNVMTDWIWDGNSSFPHTIHSSCVDKDGNAVTSSGQQAHHAEVIKNFDNWDSET